MRIVKIIVFCVLTLTLINVNAYGDRLRGIKVGSYIPSVGDTIAFYPLNIYYKGNALKAYSCFYNYECVKKGFKDKFRFNPDNSGLTPSSEISDSYMRVENILPSYEYKREKFFVINFTRIVDGEQIILAIPYSMKGVPTNAIERYWFHHDFLPFFSIPFYTKSFLDYFKQMVNKEIIFYGKYNTDTELYDMLEFANESNNVTNLNCYRGKKYVVKNLGFLSTSSALIYPNLYCTILDTENKAYNIPITYFVGNAKLDYLVSEKMENLFDSHFKRSIELTNMIKNFSPESEEGKLIKKFSGQDVYYAGLKQSVSMLRDYKYEIRNVSNNIPYSIQRENYRCLGFQYKTPYLDTNNSFELYALLEDSAGSQFVFPAVKFNYGDINYNFDDFFMLKSEAEEYEKKLQSEVNELDEKVKYYTKKYGATAANGIVYNGCTEDRYIKLRKKYNKF